MRNLKSLVLLFSIVAVLAVGCKKEDHDHDHDDIKISFVSPGDGEVIDNSNIVKVDIRIESEHELHEIEIEMYAHGVEELKLIDEDLHVHENEYVFYQELDLSLFPSGTHFHLNVTVCEDHDCEKTHKKGIEFSLR